MKRNGKQRMTRKIWNNLLVNPIVVDVETTISNNGNVFDVTNQLITIQIYNVLTKETNVITDFTNSIVVHNLLKHASLIIGANLKFDLGWLRKVCGYICETPVWDIQLAEFMFSGQRWAYPDLDTMAINYEVGHKIDTIKLNYWDQGINTTEIPIEELIEYGIEDCKLTRAVFQKQVEKFQGDYSNMFLLFRMHCNDLIVLHEMEFNGLPYDEHNSLLAVDEYTAKVSSIDLKLDKLFQTDIKFNYGSTDDISILLYGGIKKVTTRIPIGVFKTGKKTGEVRFKKVETYYEFPQLVQPIPRSALKKEGFYSTNEPTLLSLNPNRKVKNIITLLLERSKTLKIIGTYLEGLPKLRAEMNWPPGMLYPTYNQCQANTGRLSSSCPNAQNQTYESKKFFISRFT